MGHLCFINPPGIKTTSGLQMHTPNPPLGMAYVAAAVRQAGHQVTVIDATGSALDRITPLAGRPDILVQGLTPARIVERIPDDTDAVGVGCTFSSLWPIVREIIRAVAAARPDLPIIVGGEHASAVPEHVLQTSAAHVCVIGEGERTIVELLPALLGGHDLSGIDGLVYRDDGHIIRTLPRLRVNNIDELPVPAWDLFPIEAYIERNQMSGINRGRAMPILGTRGCPFRCTFCSSPQMWTTAYRRRDVGSICDEIEQYMRLYGATDFHFQDLTAIVHKKWILDFCAELRSRGLNITWQLPSGTRCEVIDDEVCSALYATGCRNMSYAPESGCPDMLDRFNKRLRLESMLASIRAALRHKLSLSCFFVIGFPGESTVSLRRTRRLIRRLAWMGVEDVGVAKFFPYPGSVMFESLLASGQIELNDTFFLGPMDSYSGRADRFNFTEGLSARRINRWMIRLYLNFYLLSFMRHPLRALSAIGKGLFSGREDTRYTKWLGDRFRIRHRWKQAARRPASTEVSPSTAACPHRQEATESRGRPVGVGSWIEAPSEETVAR